MLSEEEIINILYDICIYKGNNELSKKEYQAIQGILDLYNKEKEKNKKLENAKITDICSISLKENIEKDYISKDKLSKLLEKRIKQYRKIGFNEAYSALVDLDEELLEERN